MLSPREYNRLKWRARRGMLELDLLLAPFVEERFPRLASQDQAAFARLLEREDAELQRWFSRKGQAQDPALQRLVELILARGAR